jgi:acetoacetyl-CoA synthetase
MTMQPIWQPTPERIAGSEMTAFIAAVNRRWGSDIVDYASLHRFSIEQRDRFWLSVWDHFAVIAESQGDIVIIDGDKMPGARWFPQARLNFGRNMLRRRDDDTAIVALREDGVRRSLSFRELYDLVSRVAQAMTASGVVAGDRVAAYIPNIPEAVAGMIAAASIGAIWCCCAPEFGVAAAVDRLGQVEPKLLLTADGYLYGGGRFDLREKTAELAKALPSVETVVVAENLEPQPDIASIPKAARFADFIAPFPKREIPFTAFPFNHPVFILFSSGTTGAPKCIVHGAGGILLENLKSLGLQFDVKPGDRVYWWTTTGWVVWNMMAFSLARGASIVLYDGSPFYPTPDAILRHTADERATFIRLTPKYVESLMKADARPNETHDFSALRTMIVSSSPFGADGYSYIYDNVKRDIHLGSPSGGTDPLGSLVSASPISPVWPGEIQGPALGFSIEIFDDTGRPVESGAGELVVTRPFPSMPIAFWNDRDGGKYRGAYFSHFPNVWRHGDWAQHTEHGGVVIFGRSDATLNARGIRIGTAEIYRQIAAIPEIADCVAVSQEWDGDTRIVLFVKMRDHEPFDASLADRIRARIRQHLSPRHVPDKILCVPEIPLTSTGKISEIAVQSMIHGKRPPNENTLANPGALKHFSRDVLPELTH